jgi:pimeloyl-ACP methyl ester carboxylesterase
MSRSVRFDLPGAVVAADIHDGAGAPFLLLHGIPGSRRTWRRVAESLRGAPLLVPDLLGFGESGDPPGDFHAPGQAAALLEFLDRVEAPGVHLAGFDFGGPIALELYRRAPRRILSLTLIATNAFRDTPIPGVLRAARVPLAGEALFFLLCSWLGLAALWFGAASDRRAYPWREHRAGIPPRRGRHWTRRIFLESLRHLERRYAAAEATLATIGCPCAVVWGDRDPFFPIAVGERTAARIPAARLVVLPGCGHFVPHERGPELAAALRATALTAPSALRQRA